MKKKDYVKPDAKVLSLYTDEFMEGGFHAQSNLKYCCPIKPLYTAISSLNPAEIGMISSYFKFQAPY